MTRPLKLGLTAAQIAKRRDSIGGSDATIIAKGEPQAVLDLYRRKIGEQPEEDLSGVLAVMLGSWTEEFNRYWYEKTSGRDVTDEGLFRTHRAHGWMTCNLDGRTLTEAGEPAVFEAKHVNAFAKVDEVVQRYAPQLTHNMLVDGSQFGVLSILLGTQTHYIVEMALDPDYAAELVDREAAFWRAVMRREPPVTLPELAPTVPPDQWRELDLSTSNSWAKSAAEWSAHRAAAKLFGTAVDELKLLVPADVRRAWGHGVEAKRAKNGALTFRETE